MPLATNPLPRAPNVPPGGSNGLPAVLTSINSAIDPIIADAAFLAADAAALIQAFAPPSWGVFDDDGNQLLFPDTILEVEYVKDYRVSSYPVEQGSFRDYNKVETPAELRVSMAYASGAGDRATFLAACYGLVSSLRLVGVLMPEVYYGSLNAKHMDYRRRREDGGASKLVVDMWFEQIRVSGTQTFSNTKETQSQDPQDGGTTTPQPATSSQDAAIGTPT
jgi:hypothetical protein